MLRQICFDKSASKRHLLPKCFKYWFWLTDGVPSEPLHFAGWHVHRQLGAFRERRPDPLLSGVWLPEHHFDPEDYPGMNLYNCFFFVLDKWAGGLTDGRQLPPPMDISKFKLQLPALNGIGKTERKEDWIRRVAGLRLSFSTNETQQ